MTVLLLSIYQKPSDLCAEQLKDEELQKTIKSFEDTEKSVD